MKKFTEEHKRNISESLKGKNNPMYNKKHTEENKKKCNTRGRPRKNPNNILDVSSKTTRKILTRMNLKCSYCGWNKDICDIHHINGKKIKNPNNHYNLSYLCPNCHRLAGKDKILKEELINLYDYIGDNWKQYYYNMGDVPDKSL